VKKAYDETGYISMINTVANVSCGSFYVWMIFPDRHLYSTQDFYFGIIQEFRKFTSIQKSINFGLFLLDGLF